MSPRPYRLGQRQAATEQTRAKILEAARLLLSAEAGVAGFTIDAVARQAGVARMTVYYQFSSKRGLLEALFDDLANRSLVGRLIPALQTPEPRAALCGIIEAFAGFWAAERLVMRRVRSLAALDPEVDESVRARDERRREHLRRIVGRLQPANDRPHGSPGADGPPAPAPAVATATVVATVPAPGPGLAPGAVPATSPAMVMSPLQPPSPPPSAAAAAVTATAAKSAAAPQPMPPPVPVSAASSCPAPSSPPPPTTTGSLTDPQPDAADILHTLTSFEMFDTLAGANRPLEAATASIHRLAWLALGLPPDPVSAALESPESPNSIESPANTGDARCADATQATASVLPPDPPDPTSA